MIIYNVTSKVAFEIEAEWVKWMREEHLAEVVATGCFTHAQLLRLLESDDDEGATYTAQYFTTSKELQETYIEEFSASLREKAFAKWGNRFISFRSVMELVQ
jgi:hypothetical protein